MSIYKRREKFSGFSTGVGRIFGKLGISANAFTALALIITLFSAYSMIKGHFILAAALFIIAAFLDSVDGAVARYRKESSKLGAYFDTIFDRYMEGIIALGFILLPLPALFMPAYFWAAIYLFGSMTITYAKAAAKEKGLGDVRGGLMERPERLILIFLGILLAYFSTLYLTYVLVLLAILCNITALQRIRIAIKNAK